MPPSLIAAPGKGLRGSRWARLRNFNPLSSIWAQPKSETLHSPALGRDIHPTRIERAPPHLCPAPFLQGSMHDGFQTPSGQQTVREAKLCQLPAGPQETLPRLLSLSCSPASTLRMSLGKRAGG